MTQTFVVDGELIDLNAYINAERGNRYQAANIKKCETLRCSIASRELAPITEPVYIMFDWHTKNLRKDPDNVAFAKKVILDGLVEAGILQGDGRRYVLGFADSFYVDAERPRVQVDLIEGVAGGRKFESETVAKLKDIYHERG